MKVPKPGVGVDVSVHVSNTKGEIYLYDGTIIEVDHVNKTFHIGVCSWYAYSLERYHPAPTMNNFLRAIAEWDYHYRAADDPKIYEEGREHEQALIELFKRLPDDDKYSCRKIVEIVVMSTESK